jgi:hypothetical protein
MTPRPLAVLALILAVGCSNGSKPTTPTSTISASTSTSTSVVATSAVPTTTTAAAPTTVATTLAPSTTTAPEPIESQLQHLLDRYDAAVVGILADPRVASDSTNPKVVAFLSLFPKGSAFAADTVKLWAGEGAKGRFYRPGPGGSIFSSTLQTVTRSSSTDVTFTVCTSKSAEIVDAAGAILEAVGGVNSGEINATKVDGAWLLVDLTQTAAPGCPKPGA